MFYEKLRTIYPTLTYSEKKIADFIFSNKAKMNNVTSQALADKLKIGQATVIRFSKKLGYRNYRNMLLALENDADNFSEVEEIQLDESTATTNEKIKNKIKDLIDFAYEENSSSDFDKAIDLILEAKVIYCYGFMSTRSVADHMNELLQLFGLNSFCMDAYETMSSLRNTENALLIVFSKSGETDVTNEVVGYACDKGAKIIAVTSFKPNSIVKKHKVNLWLKCMYSEVKTRFIHYTETMALFYLVDCLILNLYKRDFTRYSDNVVEHNSITHR